MSEDAGLLDRLTDRTRSVVRLSAAFCKKFAHREIEPGDLLDALAHRGGISDAALADTGYVKKEEPKAVADADHMIGASESLKTIIAEAHDQARSLGHHYVGTEHLLLAIVYTNPELIPEPNAVRSRVLHLLGLLPEPTPEEQVMIAFAKRLASRQGTVAPDFDELYRRKAELDNDLRP